VTLKCKVINQSTPRTDKYFSPHTDGLVVEFGIYCHAEARRLRILLHTSI